MPENRERRNLKVTPVHTCKAGRLSSLRDLYVDFVQVILIINGFIVTNSKHFVSSGPLIRATTLAPVAGVSCPRWLLRAGEGVNLGEVAEAVVVVAEEGAEAQGSRKAGVVAIKW